MRTKLVVLLVVGIFSSRQALAFSPGYWLALKYAEIGFPLGACCHPNGNCDVISEIECTGIGGDYLGDDTTCSRDQCGACCSLESCDVMFLSTCTVPGKAFLPGEDCDPNPCENLLIPAVSTWGTVVMGLLFLTAGTVVLRNTAVLGKLKSHSAPT